MDSIQETDTELVERAPEQEAGAAGACGKAGKLKPWKCPDCRTSYRIEKPHPSIAPSMCEFRHADGKLCGRQFYCALTKANAKMIMWPHPEATEAPADDLLTAARYLRDVWTRDTHHTKLFEAVSAVCRAVDAKEGRA